MVLVDTSVWIDHLRRGRADLAAALKGGLVGAHPFVIGELACGPLKPESPVIGLLAELPGARELNHSEAVNLLERRGLSARGIGWIDVHLLGSALLERWSQWTLDRHLGKVARDLGIAWENRA